jgi:hypothetical protein
MAGRTPEAYRATSKLLPCLPGEPPSFWNEPAIALVPTSAPELVELVPGLRPFDMIAVWHVPIVGEMVARWHEGFDPRTADWYDVRLHECVDAFPSGSHQGLGQSLGIALSPV